MLIVDPIFRGSRLHYSYLASRGAERRGVQPHILTRTEAITDHYEELFNDISATLHPEIELPEGFWYGRIGIDGCMTLVEKMLALHAEFCFDNIFIAGLNELRPDLADACDAHDMAPLANVCVTGVEYDATYLLRGSGLPPVRNPLKAARRKTVVFLRKERQRYWLRRLHKAMPLFKTAVLDERAFDPNLRVDRWQSRLLALPDTPPDPPQIGGVTDYSDKGTTTLLLVGRQDRRKGLFDVVHALRKFDPSVRHIRTVLCGSLSEDTEKLRSALNGMGEKLLWNDGYLPEAEIQSWYQSTDYVVLPYTRDFEGSSGVMANAMRAGRPVISTDHGCIGYRVKKFDLGSVYEAGNPEALRDLLAQLPERHEERFDELSRNCKNYARKCNPDEFARAIFRQS